MIKCGHHHPTHTKPTYPEIAYIAFGKIGYYIAWFGITSMTIGVCGSYLVFMGSTTSGLISDFVSMSPMICSLIIMIPIIFLSWFRNYKFLVPTSQCGIAALIFALIVTLIHAFDNFSIHNNDITYYDIKNYPLFLGNVAFLYLIHSVVLPIEQGTKGRKKKRNN